MPHSDLHKKKRMKNYALLAIIVGWCALIWIIAMIRMGGG